MNSCSRDRVSSGVDRPIAMPLCHWPLSTNGRTCSSLHRMASNWASASLVLLLVLSFSLFFARSSWFMSSMNQPTSSEADSIPDMEMLSLGSRDAAAVIASCVQPCFGTCSRAARASAVFVASMELLFIEPFVLVLLFLVFVVVALMLMLLLMILVEAAAILAAGNNGRLVPCPLDTLDRRSVILAMLFMFVLLFSFFWYFVSLLQLDNPLDRVRAACRIWFFFQWK
mmetsp:Transcript_1811/g.3894  ORF Transcript_1811/g.3894 Transcript_1811/m.3894 type:complete len:227 (+) Transcript_1811:594-1274(+)